MILQKIKNPVKDDFQLACRYFGIMSILNDLELVKRDIQLLAYAVSENKPVSEVKEDFVEKFGSSIATVGNIISKLYRINILVKNKRIVSINPGLLIDFKRDIGLAIEFKHGDKG